MFSRNGDDLHCTISLPMTAAALGIDIPLETLDGEEDIQVPQGTQSGYEHVIRSHGVPHLRGQGRGTLTVRVEVETPGDLTQPQRELLEQLAALRGEENPTGKPVEQHSGLFTRLKDAFSGK